MLISVGETDHAIRLTLPEIGGVCVRTPNAPKKIGWLGVHVQEGSIMSPLR